MLPASSKCGDDDHLLFWSSLLFVWPACRLPPGFLRAACGAVVVTSVWYHSGHTDVARVVDVATVRVLVALAAWTWWRRRRRPTTAPVALAVAMVLNTAPAFREVCASGPCPMAHWAHLAMHVCGVVGLLRLA